MAKQRKEAPAITVAHAHKDLRLKLEQDYDKKFPDYKHFWADARAYAGKGVEPVRGEDGAMIENGLSVFCRIPYEAWKRRMLAASDHSLDMYKAAIGGEVQYDGKPATVFANPRRPVELRADSLVETDGKDSKED